MREDSKDISAKKTPKVKLRVRYNLTHRFVSKNLPEYDMGMKVAYGMGHAHAYLDNDFPGAFIEVTKFFTTIYD